MSKESAYEHLIKRGFGERIREYTVSTATVDLAAQAVGVIPARIAKTICIKDGEGCILIVAAGDAKVDNRKFKDRFSIKPTMLGADDVLRLVGHAVGGVCPFGIPPEIPVYIDESLKRFESVFPAVGSAATTIELTIDEILDISDAREWVDVCKLPGDAQ